MKKVSWDKTLEYTRFIDPYPLLVKYLNPIELTLCRVQNSLIERTPGVSFNTWGKFCIFIRTDADLSTYTMDAFRTRSVTPYSLYRDFMNLPRYYNSLKRMDRCNGLLSILYSPGIIR